MHSSLHFSNTTTNPLLAVNQSLTKPRPYNIRKSNSMKQSRSWETNNNSASQEIPLLVINSPVEPVLNQMNSIYTFKHYFTKIHINSLLIPFCYQLTSFQVHNLKLDVSTVKQVGQF